jgi:hypothetical protein
MIPQPDMSHYVTQTTNLYPNFHVPATGTTQQATFIPTNGPTIPSTSNSQVQLCELVTKMMARKDIVLSRLINYNDSPIQYLSWKQTFKAVIEELSVTPAEELDLLIKWLGPDSAR